MNTVYRLVWNVSLGIWTAVSEFAKAKGKGKSALRLAKSAVISALSVAMMSTSAWAYVVGGGSSVDSKAVAIGTGANAANYTLVSGVGAGNKEINGKNVSAVAIGNNAKAVGASVAIGDNATTADLLSTAVGAYSKAGMGGSAFGVASLATGRDSVAFGYATEASGSGSQAIGVSSKATASNALAIGAGANAAGESSLSLGYTSKASGINGVAIGSGAVSSALRAVAIGSGSKSSAANAVAIGTSAVANNENDIALGTGSLTEKAVATKDVTLNGLHYIFAGGGPTSTASVGSVGNERTITNVAAGRLSASSTDAVNGSQLFATNSAVTNIYNTGTKYFHANSTGADSQASGQDAVAIGTGAVANNTNDIALGAGSLTAAAVATKNVTLNGTSYIFAGTTPGSTVSVGSLGNERTITNVAAGRLSASSTDAVNGSQLFATNSAVTNIYNTGTKYFHANSTGADSQALGQDAVAIGTGAVANNTNDIALGTGSLTAAAVATKGVKLNDVDYVFAGATPTSTVSVGSVGKERTITNVAAGRLSASSTDAVNGSQLYATNSAVTNIKNTGTKYFHANSTGADSQASGQDAVAIGMGAVANHANDIALGAGSLTAAVVGTKGVKLNDVDYEFAGATPTSTVSVGSLGNERTITNVAAGRLSGSSTDAVNGSQLYATNSAVTNIKNTGTKYFHANSTGADSQASGPDAVAIGMGAVANHANDIALGAGSLTAAAVGTTGIKLNDVDYVFAGATPTSTVSVGSLGNERTITNVAAGRLSGSSTDAVNGSQLYATNSAVTNIKNTGTKYFHANSTGTDSQALGQDAVAIGMGAVANHANDIALGAGSLTAAAVGTKGVKLNDVDYEFAGATPTSTLSVGSVGKERTITNVAAGRLSASSTDAVNGSQLYATNSAVTNIKNTGTKYFHANSTGADSQASGPDAVAIGMGAVANHANDIALGAGSLTAAAVGTTGIKLNDVDYVFAGATPTSTVSVGSLGNERTITNVAAGRLSGSSTDAVNGSQLYATNSAVTNIKNTGTKYFHANSTGTDSQALGQDAVAIGMGAVANHANDIALGAGSLTAAAVGTKGVKLNDVDYEFAGATPTSTLSVGSVGKERTITNVAAGRLSASSTDAVNGSQLYATNSAVTNIKNTGTKYFHANSTGTDSQALGLDAVAIGMGAVANHANDIALGAGSLTAATVGTTGIKLNDVDYEFAGATPTSTLSVGSVGKERTITNVAAGRLSASSTDAVNGSQLYATNSAIENIANTGTKYFHANSTGTDSQALGLDAVAIGMGAVANHANDIALGAGSLTATAVGTTGIKLNDVDYVFAGATPTSTVSVGSLGNERTITNVAAGRLSGSSTDAVNGSQLFATNSAVTNIYKDVGNLKQDALLWDPLLNAFSASHGSSTVNKITNVAEGELSKTSTDAVNGSQLYATNQKVESIDNRVTNIENNVVPTMRYLKVNSTGANAVASGTDAIALGQGAVASGDNAIATGNGAQASGNGAIATGNNASASGTGSVAIGDNATVTANNSVALGAGSVADRDNSVSVGSSGNERQITNVAAGTEDTDAVNVAQLKQVSGDVTNISNDVTNISNGKDGMFQVNNTSNYAKPVVTGSDAVAGGAGSSASGSNSMAVGTKSSASGESSVALGNHSSATAKNSVALGASSVADRENSVSVGYAGAERQITNVAAGTASTDAVNVSQLKQGITESNQYTNKQFNNLKNMLDDQKDKLSAGIAGAMAMATLPQPYFPGASMVGLSGGTYQGESAVALGLSTISDNGKWVTKFSGTTTSQGDLGASIGIGYQW